MKSLNPLLDYSGLPRFGDFEPALVASAIETLLAECRATVARLTQMQSAVTWDDFVQPLIDANERLGRSWGQIAHLNAVVNTPELRKAYNAALPKVTQYWTELGQNEALFERYRTLSRSPDFAALSPARRKVIENELRDFRLGGAELPPSRKQRFMAIREQLAELASRFSDNLLDATDAFRHVETDPGRVTGIPQDVLAAAREAAREAGQEGWQFSLQMPSYLPLMQYASDRGLRELMYRAYATRASEFGKPEWDNTPIIARILELRHELARLLGFDNYAQYSLEPKMAGSPAEVLEFLRNLGRRAKPFAERDLRELQDFARTELGLDSLQAWDISYASERLRIARYAFSDHEVKQYLPADQVLNGLFGLVERLYGLTVKEDRAPVWHPDVRFFSLVDRAGEPIGQFYLDLYARSGKRGGAWMDDAIPRRRCGSVIQAPVAYLTCNFSAPVAGKPALLTHDEVSTLFHEFGHGLHHLLTRVEDLPVAGISGVEWDAVELPSQFMENFCWEWEVLAPMTRHVETGERLPRDLFDRMLAAKNFQIGMQTVRQIEFSLFDMLLHSEHDPHSGQTAEDVLARVRAEIAVLVPAPYNRFAASFSHIFGGGYAAGYYSYKWAEVLSADVYSVFEETGVLNAATGKRFRDEILGVGGSRPALESFVAFRGRKPRIDALLRHTGMSEAMTA
ncbi:MAG: M3 family metallopeptidase [Burkholderiales bacterium]|nr:M3 family metallopeptidase [Burkholderiales bacterium]